MKIYISADMEGIVGATHWDDVDIKSPDYRVIQEQMTAEVAAACEGALAAGAAEIWVQDAHASARNIIAERLPRQAKLIRGWSGHPFMMVQEINATFQALLFVGYHSRAGSGDSPLAHTGTRRLVWMKINNRCASELLLKAYAAATVKVPLVFVSGDEGICAEATQLNTKIATVAVKKGVGNSTVNIHPHLAADRIRQKVQQALAVDLASYQIKLPNHFAVEMLYQEQSDAYRASFYPGAELIDAHRLRFETNAFFEIMRMLMFCI